MMDQRSKVIVGVIRNGQLTDSEKRHTYSLEDFDGRAAVLIVLPRTSSDVVGPDTLADASDVLHSAREQVLAGSDDPPEIRGL